MPSAGGLCFSVLRSKDDEEVGKEAVRFEEEQGNPGGAADAAGAPGGQAQRQLLLRLQPPGGDAPLPLPAAAPAAGEGGEALHDAIAGVAANDASVIIAAIAGLDVIGHSSGWDALAGAVMGMSTLSV